MPLRDALVTPTDATIVARLKVELLSRGLRVDRTASLALLTSKPAHRVRSGACGGLDVILPGEVYVNAPINESFARESPYELKVVEDCLVLSGRGLATPVQLVPAPAYYGRIDREGVSLRRIGQLCADRLGIGLTNNCFYWRSPDRRCQFCSIGLNLREEERDKSLAQIDDVVEAAYTDAAAPARHVLLGGGTPDGPDAGALLIAEAARRIKKRWPYSIYAMIVPPADDSYIDLLKESGVDELGMNIELYDRRVAARLIPGKVSLIGFERYERALEHAVQVFGFTNARSIMVIGLESMQSTLRGVEHLASLGVMPILSPFRPMAGTELEHHERPSPEFLWDVTLAASSIVERYGLPLGPTCIPCQENTLNMPGHSTYRYY